MRFLGRFFVGVWQGLDALRRFLHLLLLLALFGVVVGALLQATPRLPDKAALILRPSGDLVEQLSGEPLQRAFNEAQGTSEPQTLLWDVIAAIRAAASDSRIQALVIDTDDLSSGGQVKLEEVAAAIGDFRRAGKKVIARGNYFLQSQYFLAAQADEVYLDPFGFVLLDGYERYRMFYKDALDKLAVDMHLFRVGKFKSAAEPYIRRDMSPEDRAESEAYLQALWRGYRVGVARARGLSPEALAAYANGYTAAVLAAGGNTARVAKDSGLVTDIKTAQQVEQRLIDLVGADGESKSFRSVTMDEYLRLVRTQERVRSRSPAQIGVVIASGEILDGKQPSGTIGGESTAGLLREARLDDDIRAVVLRIDSPGGSVFASEQIYREVRALKEAGKTVVASMSDVAASGGYYIAAPADEIFASANTITGSIGVFASLPTFSRSLAKLGINVDGIGTTALSGSTRLDRPLSADAGRLLQSTVDRAYEEFLGRVSAGRGKSRDAIDAIAQGRVWAGSDAEQNGLVDQIGTYDDAIKAAATRAGLKSGYRVRRIEPSLSWAQQLLLQVRAGAVRLLVRLGVAGAGQSLTDRLLLRQLGSGLGQAGRGLQRELTRWQHLSAPNTIYAYCFCTLD
ncbi:MAG: signal peptide peptidase SppA [Steroidobacterales bacterium]